MKTSLYALAFAATLAAPNVFAASHSNDPLHTCVTAGLAAYAGTVTSVRGEMEEGKFQYEIDIAGTDNKFWEVECDGKTGKIIEKEREVASSDTEFGSKAKVTLDVALKTALNKYPGSVMKIEYEIEPDQIAYEFDIQTKNGKVLEVEVDAVTGKIGASEEILYQIGQ